MKRAVVVVIRRGDRVLVIRRGATTPGSGHWAPLAGKLEVGEDEAQAVRREALEEVGLHVRPIRRAWQSTSFDGRHELSWWLAEASGGTLRPDPREVAVTRWIRPEEFAALSPIFPGDLPFFDEVIGELGSGSAEEGK
ncbi:MAG: NUDIX domain-containing protein [Planctomycetota bacterium]|nr:NUDIX domain-containing protein [Planctomycetota bacterium]